MVHKVEQTTIKLLNNKGHLPSATSRKKVEISRWFNPGRDLPRLRWWAGGRSQHCYTGPHLILVENRNSLATHAEKEICCCSLRHVVRKILLGTLSGSSQQTPTDRVLMTRRLKRQSKAHWFCCFLLFYYYYYLFFIFHCGFFYYLYTVAGQTP